MKRVRLRSMEDFEKLPEDEWVEIVGGMNVVSTFDHIHIEDDSLIVHLPDGIRKQFKQRAGEDLQARISKGSLIVTRRRTGKGRRRT